MNRYLILGLFALLIVVVSLVRLLADREFFRLTSMKKVWGRRKGLAIHFLSNVGLPLVIGIIFLSQGVVGFSPRESPVSADMFRPLDLQSIPAPGFVPPPLAADHGSSETVLCP